MLNYHALPWDDEDWRHFLDAAQGVRSDFEHGLSKDTLVDAKNVDKLLWRHWIVAFCVRYASQHAQQPLTLVECGVGDGLTAYFACKEAEHLSADFQLHCYDTWDAVGTDVKGRTYANLSLDRTQRNLSDFPVTYHAGRIPVTLDDSAPSSVNYLSIDLNTAGPTSDALTFFVPRLTSGAVVLFDDYGHRGFEETRRTVDAFFAGRRGALLKLPTGQAIWFS
jgi:hypothetical protein